MNSLTGACDEKLIIVTVARNSLSTKRVFSIVVCILCEICCFVAVSWSFDPYERTIFLKQCFVAFINARNRLSNLLNFLLFFIIIYPVQHKVSYFW